MCETSCLHGVMVLLLMGVTFFLGVIYWALQHQEVHSFEYCIEQGLDKEFCYQEHFRE